MHYFPIIPVKTGPHLSWLIEATPPKVPRFTRMTMAFQGMLRGTSEQALRQPRHVETTAHMIEHGFATPLGIPFSFAHLSGQSVVLIEPIA
jgi:hypothetical protein